METGIGLKVQPISAHDNILRVKHVSTRTGVEYGQAEESLEDRPVAMVDALAQIDLPLVDVEKHAGESISGNLMRKSEVGPLTQSDTPKCQPGSPLAAPYDLDHQLSWTEAFGVELMPVAQQLSPEGAIVTAIFVSVVLVWALRF